MAGGWRLSREIVIGASVVAALALWLGTLSWFFYEADEQTKKNTDGVAEAKETADAALTGVAEARQEAKKVRVEMDGAAKAVELAALDSRVTALGARLDKESAERKAADDALTTGVANANTAAAAANKKAEMALAAYKEATERLKALEDAVAEVKADLLKKQEAEKEAKKRAEDANDRALAAEKQKIIAEYRGLSRTVQGARIRAEQAEKAAEAAEFLLHRQTSARLAAEKRLKALQEQAAEASQAVQQTVGAVQDCGYDYAPCRGGGLFRRWR